MVRIIRGAGRIPVQRNTLYGVVEDFSDHDPVEVDTLVRRSCNDKTAAFLNRLAAHVPGAGA